jgi:tetratricopeptide (TPR) repeat protein
LEWNNFLLWSINDKKADLLIATRKYHEAIALLDLAAIYDSLDINLYILRTDALLALDRQHEAIEILQEALEIFTGDERIELLFEMVMCTMIMKSLIKYLIA